MPSSLRPTSLGDIAKAVGLARSTVSYALRNHPKVATETRDRIKAAAREMNYIPDAGITVRMGLVRKTKLKKAVPIAWLNSSVRRNAWKDSYLRPYIDGAAARCRELGYALEEFWMKEPGMTLRRMSSILYHRGIQGVILSPSSTTTVRHLSLEWKNFASASFEGSIVAPSLHRVMPDHFGNMTSTLRTLRKSGYRRIGVFLQHLTARSSLHAYPSAIVYFHSQVSPAEHVPPLFYRHEDEIPDFSNRLFSWIRKYRPDVIVGHHSRLVEWVESQGYRVPQDIGVVHLAIDGDVEDWAGIWQRKAVIGAETAELVISMIQNHRFGLPETARDILIQGEWHSGRTLLIPKPSKAIR